MIVGNWKMYKTIEQALEFLEKILPMAEESSAQVMLAVPYTAIFAAKERVKETKIRIGAQNINDAFEGAFTGEVAAHMVKEAGADFVLVGHSERRRYFKETNAQIQKKVQRSLEVDLFTIICIGESAEERENGKTEDVLKKALKECLEGIGKELAHKIGIAYEPIWAIGTGKAATKELAEEAHSLCRKVIEELWDAKTADMVPILYGGSVNQENADHFLSMENINGLLVGNASLRPESFAKIISDYTMVHHS